jgi:hypothetical protein
MAALDFPPNPLVGDIYPVPPVPGVPQYTWNGYAWVVVGGGAGGGAGGGMLPSDAIPIMDGVGAPGTANNASRGDHVHPKDTSKADVTYVNSQAALKVSKAGDTMSGNLIIDSVASNPVLTLNKHAESTFNAVVGLRNGNARWEVDLGDGAVETGANAGSNFYLRRFSDAGAQLGLALTIIRDSGYTNIGGQLHVDGAIQSAQTGVTGTYYFGDGGTRYLTFDGVSFYLNGGQLSVDAAIQATGIIRSQSTPTTGAFYFGNGNNYLSYDGTNYTLGGGNTLIVPGLNGTGNVVSNASLYTGAAGTSGILYYGNTNTKYLQYDGTNFHMYGGAFYQHGAFDVTGDMRAHWNANAGTYRFGEIGDRYLTFDGTNFIFNGGNIHTNGNALYSGALTASSNVNVTGSVIATGNLHANGNVTYNGSVVATGSMDSGYNVDGMGNTRTVAAGAVIAILSNFSGMVLVNCHQTGQMDLWLCGAGNVVKVGTVGGSASSAAGAIPENGYVFYNNSGVTSAFGLVSFRSRSAR